VSGGAIAPLFPEFLLNRRGLGYQHSIVLSAAPALLVVALPAANLFSMNLKEVTTMKMYILIPDDIPQGFAMLAAAHAGLAGYLKFKDTPEVAQWLSPGPFYKVVCKVTRAEFERAKQFEDHVLLTESALAGQEVALAFKPRAEWPKAFKFYRLYR
jgi:hypothetical protein